MPLPNPVRSITSRRRSVSPGWRKAQSTSDPWTSDFTRYSSWTARRGGFERAPWARHGGFYIPKLPPSFVPAGAGARVRGRKRERPFDAVKRRPVGDARGLAGLRPSLACQNCVARGACLPRPPARRRSARAKPHSQRRLTGDACTRTSVRLARLIAIGLARPRALAAAAQDARRNDLRNGG